MVSINIIKGGLLQIENQISHAQITYTFVFL